MGELIGYARCSTVLQDLTGQRQALAALGVPDDRIYLDKGLTGTSRARPGLDQALAAVGLVTLFLSTYSCSFYILLPTRRLAGKWWDRRVDERRKAGSGQRCLLGIIARTPQLYGLIGQIDATGCDATDRRTRTSKPGCQPLSAAGPGDAWPSAVNDR